MPSTPDIFQCQHLILGWFILARRGFAQRVHDSIEIKPCSFMLSSRQCIVIQIRSENPPRQDMYVVCSRIWMQFQRGVPNEVCYLGSFAIICQFVSVLQIITDSVVLKGGRSCYSYRLYDFSVTIPRCYKDVYASISFIAQLDSAILCFVLTSDLNCFKSRIKRHLLFVGSFKQISFVL